MACDYKNVVEKVKADLSSVGFEVYPFKIGWYNDKVAEEFKLSYSYDTLALFIPSTPALTDKSLVPYLLREECPGTEDKLDNRIKEHFDQIKHDLPECDIEAIQDFEMLPSGKPNILVQTAGHVSGAAYYYQRKDVQPDPWDEETKIYGVSIHPKYGSWFSLTGVLIFKNLECSDLVQEAPVDIVPTADQRKELLERWNFRYQDFTLGDIIPVAAEYSGEQKQYFATPPKDKSKLLGKIKKYLKSKDAEQNG